MDAVKNRGGGGTHTVSPNRPFIEENPADFLFLSVMKSRLANTSRDSFKFRQVLGKSGEAWFMQHDLLHKGMEQGERLVSPTELRELGGGGGQKERNAERQKGHGVFQKQLKDIRGKKTCCTSTVCVQLPQGRGKRLQQFLCFSFSH